MNQRGLLVVISGPSGVGKSTVCARLVEQLGARLSISATTRPKADGEKDGRDYYFMTENEFRPQVSADEFLELGAGASLHEGIQNPVQSLSSERSGDD